MLCAWFETDKVTWQKNRSVIVGQFTFQYEEFLRTLMDVRT